MHDIEGAAVPVKRRQIPALPRLALLPFMNLSSDSAQGFFTDGLTEEMTAQLGRVCRGRITLVAPLTAVMFRGTASHALDLHETHRVDYLVDGSVRREGDRVRITARLIETAGETLLWSDVFERDVRDALSVQTEVAVVVARSLATELAAR
jgi:TolB-like protein